MQKWLDGRLLIYYRGKILTPEDAPPLASSLRAQANEINKNGFPAVMPTSFPEDVITEPRTALTKRGAIWYEDSEMKLIHRQLVKDGMKRARNLGKRIGRPRVIERPDFHQRFAVVIERIDLGVLSRRQAAKELAIGYATLKRLLDAHWYTQEQNEGGQSLPASVENHCNEYAEVVH